jgi:hypothetical protein
MIAGTAPVAWTAEDLDALPLGAVVNSHVVAARKELRGGQELWACIDDGATRTSRELAAYYNPLVVLVSARPRVQPTGRPLLPVAWNEADLERLAVTAVVDSRITARKVRRDGVESWACTDGQVRTGAELLGLVGPLVILARSTPTTDRLARGITGALPRSLDPKDTP